VRRIYDETNKTLVYLAYARQVKDGSAKMLIFVVPLYNAGAQMKADY
jgi:CreA protein